MSVFSAKPSARRDHLVVQELKDEVVLYDLETDQASCLNETAALVWKYADGKTSVDSIAAQMAQDLETPVDAQVVWFALDQLGKKNLLQTPVAMPMEYTRMSRRDFVLKAGALGAIVAMPVIISLAAPKPAMAATGCQPVGCDAFNSCPNGCNCVGGQCANP